MKKFLSAALIAFIITFSANICLANKYNDNSYYIFVTNSQGQVYLDLRTVNVHDYNPPHYQIAGDFIWVRGDNIRYNWNKKETYHRNEGYWTEDRIEYEDNNSRSNRKMADALFRAAYGMDFYGY